MQCKAQGPSNRGVLRARRPGSSLEGWDMCSGKFFFFSAVPDLESRIGQDCEHLCRRLWVSQSVCLCVALFWSSADQGGTCLCSRPAIRWGGPGGDGSPGWSLGSWFQPHLLWLLAAPSGSQFL